MLLDLIEFDIHKVTGLKVNCVYNVTNAKLYTTYGRARKYGQVRSASPVRYNGVDSWLPAGFWDASGTMNTYNILSVKK
jgi:hypothetical protein